MSANIHDPTHSRHLGNWGDIAERLETQVRIRYPQGDMTDAERSAWLADQFRRTSAEKPRTRGRRCAQPGCGAVVRTRHPRCGNCRHNAETSGIFCKDCGKGITAEGKSGRCGQCAQRSRWVAQPIRLALACQE